MEKLDIQPLDIQPLDIQPLDIQPLEDESKKKTTVGDDINIAIANLRNTGERAAQLLTAPIMDVYSRVRGGPSMDEVFRVSKQIRDERLKEATGGKEQTFGGKVVSTLATLPAFPLLIAGSPLDTAAQFLEEGESVGRAGAAGAIDLAGNLLGVQMAPLTGGLKKRVLGNAALQAAQDTATRAAIGQVAENQSTKDIFNPTVETALLAGTLGGALGVVAKNKPKESITPAEERMRAAAAAKKVEEAKAPGQMELFDTDTQGRGQNVNIPLDAQLRVDENGMPIRQDLSEELARTERAVDAQRQPDLFGNEDLMPIGNDKRTRPTVEGRNDQPLLVDERGDVFRPDQQQTIEFRNKYEQQLVDELDRRYYAENPDELAALRRQDPEAVRKAFERKEQIEQTLRSQQEDAMWQQRQPVIDEAIARRSQDAETARFVEEDLQRLQEQLSSPRVSKGQQRKAMSRMRQRQSGALDFDAIVEAFPWFKNSGLRTPLFHGTSADADFQAFKKSPRGIFLTRDPEVASSYATDNDSRGIKFDSGKYVKVNDKPRVMQVYANISNPYRLSPEEVQTFRTTTHYAAMQKRMAEKARAAGHDAIYYPDGAIVVLDPKNVQSALTTPKLNQGMARRERGAVVFSDRLGTAVVEQAKKLFKARFSPGLVFKLTGVYKDRGQFKSVISDADSTLKPLPEGFYDGKRVPLNKLLDHPKLFELYPELEKVDVRTSDHYQGSFFWEPKSKNNSPIIALNYELALGDKSRLKEVLLHEVQHALQYYDKSKTKGGSPSYFEAKYKLDQETAYNHYRALSGEQEARFTEKGNALSQQQLDDVLQGMLSAGGNPSNYTAPVVTRLAPSFKQRQRGGVLFGNNDYQQRQKAFDNIMKTDMVPEAPKGEDVVTAALQEGKDGKGWNWFESGGSLTALKRNSAAVLGASRILQRAQNLADLAIRRHVMPAERAGRSLSKPDFVQLLNIFTEENNMKRTFSVDELASFGYKPEILAAYNDFRSMFKAALEQENKARAALGKSPITELEFYTSHRWQGDFRQDFLDANGKHVWSLAGKTKKDLARQREALLKQFPDLKGSAERVVKFKGDVVSPAELYKHMLDILGADDPAVKRIKDWYENEMQLESRDMLAQEKHFKRRGDVRGYIGDRPANTRKGGFDASKEALDFFQEQITYAKNAFKWSEMQLASAEVKKIVSNPELQAQQPNNVNWVKEYWKQNLGINELDWIRGMEDTIHKTGVSPNSVREAVGTIRSAWIGQKLLGSVGFILSNFVQATAVLPHMADIAVKTGGNPIAGVMGGMLGVMTLGLPHLAQAFQRNPQLSKTQRTFMAQMPEFYQKALKYAEDNGVTSRSTYDESPLANTFNPVARGAEVVAKASMVAPETLLRSFSFMAFADQLRSSGKYGSDTEIFRLAEERTNVAMADYRAGERPMVFSKFGMLGEIAGTLQTFPVNFYNQWNWAAREFNKGNVAPALTMFSMQYLVAGFMGLPGFQDLDRLFELFKTWAAANKPELWDKIKDLNPKRVVMDQLGEESLYGRLSTESGLAMTSRVAAPSFYDMATSGGNMIADIGKQLGNVATMAVKPSENQFAKTVIESSPVGIQGALETQVFRDTVSKPAEGGQLYNKRGTNEGDFIRTPEDEAVRAWGLRTQREALTKDETYQLRKRTMEATKVSAEIVDQFYSAVTKEDSEKARSLWRLYITLTGKEITEKQLENRVLKDVTDSTSRAITAAKQLEAMKAIARMRQIVGQSESP